MFTVLLLSSHVARGAVGLRAAGPIFNRFGIKTIEVPTVFLSHHPGHGSPAGAARPAQDIADAVAALGMKGWLGAVDAVVTGYFADADQVEAAVDAIARTRIARPQTRVLCDPILGDDPKGLYVAAPVVDAIRDRLIPLADIATPNRFELETLTGEPLRDLKAFVAAARALAPEAVATSAPLGPGRTGAAASAGGRVWMADGVAVSGAPTSGAGDVFAATYLSRRLAGASEAAALGHAAGALHRLMRASRGQDELALVESLDSMVSMNAETAREWRGEP